MINSVCRCWTIEPPDVWTLWTIQHPDGCAVFFFIYFFLLSRNIKGVCASSTDHYPFVDRHAKVLLAFRLKYIRIPSARAHFPIKKPDERAKLFAAKKNARKLRDGRRAPRRPFRSFGRFWTARFSRRFLANRPVRKKYIEYILRTLHANKRNDKYFRYWNILMLEYKIITNTVSAVRTSRLALDNPD